ncbi:MAG: PIN domain-containing protein [Candidatus Eremiobacteraeota bacterium]|nr:PIN domain-containing protein [Candidatus Eremiobacteraeota bacterium]
MKKLFIDTDIIFDLLSAREPFYHASASLFSIVERREVKAFVSTLSISHLFYFLRKLKGSSEAIISLQKLKALVSLLPVDEKTIDLSLISDFPDFEDAIQYHSALAEDIDYFITRNIGHYKKSRIKVVTAEEFIRIWPSRIK